MCCMHVPQRHGKSSDVCCLQELRSKVEASQSQHAEMLRRAQDICIEAEDRAVSLEKRADKAELRASRAEAELSEAKSEAKHMTSDLKVRRLSSSNH